MTLIEENIIEIAWMHQRLCTNNEYVNTDFDSKEAKQEILSLAQIFEQKNKNTDWENEDYYVAIEEFAKEMLREWNESDFIHIPTEDFE